MATSDPANVSRLRLETVAGPELSVFEIEPGGTGQIGRVLECTIRLPHQTVSRHHAVINSRGGTWFLTDQESRHGTHLNGVQMTSHTPAELHDADLIRIGPWTMRVSVGRQGLTTASVRTVDDTPTLRDFVQRVEESALGSLARQRLSLLIDCAATIHGVPDEEELAHVVLDSALAGTGFGRAALLRSLHGDREVEVLASRAADGTTIESLSFSRSLIAEASSGQLARLTAEQEPRDISMSIAELRIQAALCAPILVGSSIAAYLYLDARGHEACVRPDAAEFCEALARMAGLALANLKRLDLERRQHLLESQMTAAGEVQELIVPTGTGQVGACRYALEMRPGLFVAGDLFDVFPLADGKIAICMGDVTGEGIGAAILMATTQSFLHAALSHLGDPVQSLQRLNKYLVAHSAANRFVSMWAGVLDPFDRSVCFVDAGHGHWLHVTDHDALTPAADERGIPLGIDEDFAYRSATLTLAESDRLILFSDGLTEQRSVSGEPFGLDRVREAIDGSTAASTDLRQILLKLDHHIGGNSLDDDTTVASIEWAPASSPS